MFVEYDTIGFIAALAPNSVNEGLSGWKALYEEWHEAVDKEWQRSGQTAPGSLEKAQRAILGETLLFQALCDPSVEDELIHLGREVQRALPGRHPGSWWETPYVTAQGFAVWDAQGRQPEDRHQRTMCILAPGDKERELDEWAWTTSGLRLPPFARCLLHAAKLRYERHVYLQMRSLREVRTEVEEALVPLTELHAQVDRGQPLRAGELAEALRRSSHVQTKAAGLLVAGTELRELQQTVLIAQANLKRALSPGMRQGAGEPLFASDLDIADWLISQVSSDLVYLDALRERACEIQALTATRLQVATQSYHDRLTLLQTSFLGALLMALCVIQAFQIKVPLPPSTQWPAVALLAALALALPPAVLRLFGGLSAQMPYRWVDGAYMLILGASAAWLATTVAWRQAAGRAAPGYWSLMAAAIVAAVSVALSLRLARHGRSGSEPSSQSPTTSACRGRR
jgi:hypothetical protein